MQAALIHDTLLKFRDLDVCLKVYYTPTDSGSYFHGLGIPAEPQGKGDLGVRMRRCINRELTLGCGKVLLVGTDIPELPPDEILRGYDLLEKAPLVFGPARDGGYYAVGTRRVLPSSIFTNIPWSTANVLEVTERKARAEGLASERMGTYGDVDTWEDLLALRRGNLMPATRRWLDGLSSMIDADNRVPQEDD